MKNAIVVKPYTAKACTRDIMYGNSIKHFIVNHLKTASKHAKLKLACLPFI